jgi:hypothetical protein
MVSREPVERSNHGVWGQHTVGSDIHSRSVDKTSPIPVDFRRAEDSLQQFQPLDALPKNLLSTHPAPRS